MKLSGLLKLVGVFAIATKGTQTFPNFTMCNSFSATENAFLTIFGQRNMPIALIGETTCQTIDGNNCQRTSVNTSTCSASTQTLYSDENSGSFILGDNGIINSQLYNDNNVYSCVDMIDDAHFDVLPSQDYSCDFLNKKKDEKE